jgi:hypothetical protein
MTVVKLERKAGPEREPEHVWALEPEPSDEAGKTVGVVGEPEGLCRRIRRLPASRSVPRDDVEFLGERRHLAPPVPAVT